ncbi:MAG: hypothetical protein ACXV3D_00235 [Halobacteriota archaeon]
MNDQKYCPSCGEVNPGNAAFCAKCGNPFRAASVTGMLPASPPSYYESIPPTPPPRRLKKRYVLYGVIGLFVLFIAVSAAFPSSSSSSATATPSPTVMASVAATQTKASVAPTVKATPTPAPTVKPTPEPSAPTLTESQRKFLDSGMVAKGYTVIKPLAPNGQTADGNNMYSGQLMKDGTVFSTTFIMCRDTADTNAQFTKSVTALEDIGYSGSYKDSQTWQGAKIENGSPSVALATASSDGTLKYVMTMFAT